MFRKFMKKFALLLTTVSMAAVMPAMDTMAATTGYYAYPVTCAFTGDNATDIVSVALSQTGYQELQHDNYTKYNMWYYGTDYNVPWCAIFLSWCANQAGISESIIKKTAYVSGMSTSNMSSNGYGCPAYAFSATSAKPGDIVYIDNSGDNVSDHVGMVYEVDDTYIYTVEGNASDSVRLNTYLVSNGHLIRGTSDGGSVSSTKILFYARPDYGYTDPATIGTTTEEETATTSVIPEITDCDSWYSVTASSLNVRMGPATTYKSLGSISNGTVIHATGTSGDWARFDYGDVEGWVSVKYLKETENPNPEETTTETTTEESTEIITEEGTENTTEEGTETTTEGSTVSTTESPAVTTTEAAPVASNDYIITASSLNVRKGPGTNYSAIGGVSRNTKVTILETSGDWGKINYNGSYGWIKMSYCKKVEDTPVTTTEKATTTTTEAAATTTTEAAVTATTETTNVPATEVQQGGTTWTYKVTASSLSVRKGNSTSYARLGYLSNGTVVTVTEVSSNNWGKITYNGSTGWISLDYCKLISENKPAVTTTEKSVVTTTESTKETTSDASKTTTEAPVTVVKSWNYQVTADLLNVRSGGSTSYKVIGTISYGTKITVEEISKDNWGRFNYNGQAGWVSLQYAKLTGTNTVVVTTEAATTTTTQAPVSTTETPKATTTEVPAVTTTEAPVVTTTEGTTVDTTETPAVSTTETPVVTTTEASVEPTTETPVITTTEASVTPTTETTVSPATEQTSATVYYYNVTASSLYVRTGPGQSYSSIGSLSRGDVVAVMEISSNNWGKINYYGNTGWISLDYCQKR